MKYNVNFTFSEVLQAGFPGLEINVEYYGRAMVVFQNDIEIKNTIVSVWAFVNSNEDCGELFLPKCGEHISKNEVQFLTSGKMGEFLGKCREAARNAYYKERMKEAATQHNAGFIPMASDISYMEESDRFPDVTIDRS